VIAKQLTQDEMHALAVFYGIPGNGEVTLR
jgi:hypothetical protein